MKLDPTALYSELLSIPLPTAGRFLDQSSVQLSYSVTDHTRNTKRTTSSTIWLDAPAAPKSTPAQDVSDVRLAAASPSRRLEAVLRETADQKRFVEIWRNGQLDVCHDVTDAHDAFYNDPQYGTLNFSPSETAVVYTAEAKVPSKTNPSYEKFKYVPPLGERYPGRKRPTTFVFRWAAPAPSQSTEEYWDTPSLTALDYTSLPAGTPTRFGQALFDTSDAEERQLYATGYDLTPDGRLLGVVFCSNRPSGIWALTLPPVQDRNARTSDSAACRVSAAVRLTPVELACRSPRIDDATGSLYFLACAVGGPHASTASLWRLPAPANADVKPQVVLDVVLSPYGANADLDIPFPGFYPDITLPRSPFVMLGGKRFVVSASTWRSRNTVVLISTDDGSVRDLCPMSLGDDPATWSVLATDGVSRLLCVRSAPAVPYEIVLGILSAKGEVEWTVVARPTLKASVKDALSRISCSILRVPEHKTLEAIVISPSTTNGESPPPCILEPHGGPHATFDPSWSARTAAFVAAGYTVLHPNYTGSLGFGDAAVRALPGNCGTLDVQDCIATLRELIKQGKAPDERSKLFYLGGSHGGYIGGHVIGQYPDMFAACVLRNPVISAGEMSTTDIPDWYFAEFGVEYSVVEGGREWHSVFSGCGQLSSMIVDSESGDCGQRERCLWPARAMLVDSESDDCGQRER